MHACILPSTRPTKVRNGGKVGRLLGTAPPVGRNKHKTIRASLLIHRLPLTNSCTVRVYPLHWIPSLPRVWISVFFFDSSAAASEGSSAER